MYSFFSAVSILILIQISHIAGKYSIRRPNNPVIGYLGKEVILPCMLETLESLAKVNISIQWVLEKSEKIEVKNYNKNYGEIQNRRYQDRTELFVSEINKGNMSLLLRNISLFDEGLYTCKIFLGYWYDKVMVQLALAANGDDPTITLVGYNGQGIGLTCSAEGWYPTPQIFWLDSKGKNWTEKSAIADVKIMAGIFLVFASITIEPGVDSEISCKIINNLVNSERESRVYISDVFNPTSSPWIGPFTIILVLFGCLIAFVTHKLKQNLQKISQFKQEINEKETERNNEENAIETQKNMSEANVIDIQHHQERLIASLELKRNQIHAVAVYLDSECKHPDLIITKDQKRATLEAFGEAKSAGGSLVVVGKEGYVAGKHYWEVRVGDRLDWELGVLTQSQRDKARKENFSMPLGEGHWALRSVRGDLFSSQSKEKIEKKNIPYLNIGLFLNQESRELYFYNANMQAPFPITTITIQSTEKLYPFLSFNECASEHVQNTL